jgi:hypothetical protein
MEGVGFVEYLGLAGAVADLAEQGERPAKALSSLTSLPRSLREPGPRVLPRIQSTPVKRMTRNGCTILYVQSAGSN